MLLLFWSALAYLAFLKPFEVPTGWRVFGKTRKMFFLYAHGWATLIGYNRGGAPGYNRAYKGLIRAL